MKTPFASLKLLLLLLLTALFFSGCLIAEKKEYVFNLVSQDDEDQDVSFKDFAELVTDYIQGDKFANDNPQFIVTDKKLYELDGELIGEVSVTFTSWDSVGFFRTANCDCCPTLYYLGGDNNETYESSNGEFLGATGNLPLVVYPAGTKVFTISTSLLTDLSGTRSLMEHYNNWKK
jgi:hypothetical protein